MCIVISTLIMRNEQAYKKLNGYITHLNYKAKKFHIMCNWENK